MKIPATKEEILENFKKNSNGRPLNKDDYEIAEALSRITYKAYEVGMEDAKQLNMEDMMDNKSELQELQNTTQLSICLAIGILLGAILNTSTVGKDSFRCIY